MSKLKKFQTSVARAWRGFVCYWRAKWWHKAWLIFVLAILLIVGAMYGIARWYQLSEPAQPALGVTFIPSYASELGLDPQATMTALENIGVKNFRLVSYWNEIEPKSGKYDFSQLDWQFKIAEEHHSTVSLAIGLRQPRWPECHVPSWIDLYKEGEDWQTPLKQFITKVVERYKNNPALKSYQLENEFFNQFGDCNDSSRDRLISEFNLVKKLDPVRPIILTRSNNYPNVPTGQPRADVFGIENYHVVWAPLINGHFHYPMPSWYYSFLAGATKIFTGRDSIITEAQAEPWPAPDQTLTKLSLADQQKLLDAKTLKSWFNFSANTKIPMVYYWGAGYWYYRKVVLHDPSLWNAAQQEFNNSY